jgi:hypothetical protein
MMLWPWLVLERLREPGAFLEVAAGNEGDNGRYEESEACEVAIELVLPLLPPIAAGGRAKVESN